MSLLLIDVNAFNIPLDVKVVNMPARSASADRPGTGKSAPYHHGDLRRALTDAALDLIGERGPKGFTLTEVARRGGVSAAALYHAVQQPRVQVHAAPGAHPGRPRDPRSPPPLPIERVLALRFGI
jgi:Bacterial regulatory proteins, tetR family